MPRSTTFLGRHLHPLRRNLFAYAQLSLLGSFGILAGTASQTESDPTYPDTFFLAVVLVGISLVAFIPSWDRVSQKWLILWGVADFAIIATLRTELAMIQPGLSIIVLLPVLWMAFSMGFVATIVAIVGAYFVSLSPYVFGAAWPSTPGHWGAELLLPSIVAVAAVANYLASANLRQQRRKLRQTNNDLRISIERASDAGSAASAVVDTVDAGITFYDEDGEILLTNDAARGLAARAGRTIEGHISFAPHVFYEDRVTPIPEEDSIAAKAARGELTTGQTIWIGTGSQQRAVVASSKHVRRANGQIIGTVVATHDVTDLLLAIHSRDEFVETVSHELRTPLTSIMGYMEVLEDTVDLEVPGVADAFATVNRNSQRLLALIEALLAEAAGFTPTQRSFVDIPGLITRSVRTMQPQADAAGVQIEVERRSLVKAEVDQDSIVEVVDRLLSNAIKFSDRGSTVSISVDQEADHAVIRVADTGSGISAADQDHVFERFYRGANARTAVIPGAGLGLSKAKGIVDAHRGVISVHAGKARGTTMEVRLPILTA